MTSEIDEAFYRWYDAAKKKKKNLHIFTVIRNKKKYVTC